MMKMLLLSAMVVGPCLANQGRFAEDLDDSAPNEAPLDAPTSFGSKIQMTLSGNLASGVYTDAYFTNSFFPAIKTSMNLASTVVFVLNDKRDGSVIVDFTIYDPSLSAASLQALATEIVRQANDPNSPLRQNSVLQNIEGATLLTVLPPTPTHADDDGLSDGAIAGIVIGCLVGVAIIVVLVYCVACKDDESQAATTAPAAPYGGGNDEPQKPESQDVELAEKPKDEEV